MKKEIRGFIIGVITSAMFSATMFTAFAEPVQKVITAVYDNIKIFVDGSLVQPKDAKGDIVEPFIYNGTTYLPVRAVSEALGKNVTWDGNTNSVYIGQKPDQDIKVGPSSGYTKDGLIIHNFDNKDYVRAFDLEEKYNINVIGSGLVHKLSIYTGGVLPAWDVEYMIPLIETELFIENNGWYFEVGYYEDVIKPILNQPRKNELTYSKDGVDIYLYNNIEYVLPSDIINLYSEDGYLLQPTSKNTFQFVKLKKAGVFSNYDVLLSNIPSTVVYGHMSIEYTYFKNNILPQIKVGFIVSPSPNNGVKPTTTPGPEVTPYSENGNTSGNLANSGYVAQKGDWIYYRNSSVDDKLYKIKTDGTGKTKLTDDKPLFINVVSDWVYYANESDENKIYKIKTDGTNKTKLNDDSSGNILAVGDYIYFSTSIGINVYTDIYRMKNDGTSKVKITNGLRIIAFINVIDGWIYFSDDYDGRIYKMKDDGTKETKLNDCRIGQFVLTDGSIYYSNEYGNGALYSMSVGGFDNTEFNFPDKVNDFTILDGWIYYSNKSDGDKLYKMKIDRTSKTKLSDIPASDINTAGNWIYYRDKSNKAFFLYRVKIDGSEQEMVN